MRAKTFCLLNKKCQYKYPPKAERKINNSNAASLKKIKLLIATFISLSVFAQKSNDTLHYPEEKHFKNVQQLTFGGDNAEAYWSYEDTRIIFQRTDRKENIICEIGRAHV